MESENRVVIRRKMVQWISQLLNARMSRGGRVLDDATQIKIERTARQLEQVLYAKAESLQEYKDTSTLRVRLENLALEIAQKEATKHRD